MKNKVQDKGAIIQVVAPYALSSGNGALVGTLFGVAEADALISASVNIDTEGVFDITKATGGVNSFQPGDRVFWDNTNRNATPSSSGNKEIGIATAAALAAATTVRVRLGMFESLRQSTVTFHALLNAAVVSQVFFIAPVAMKVLGVQEVHSTLGTSGSAVTGDVVKCTGTQAIGSGVTVVSATADLKGANNTVQSLSPSATVANTLLAAGDRLGFVLGGTATSVAGVVITVDVETV